MNKDLLSKYKKDSAFKKEVEAGADRYRVLEQGAAFSDLSIVPEGILKKVPDRNIYFYFGYQQPTSIKSLSKVAMFLAKNFKPPTDQKYILVFFNELCLDNYVLWNFRETFGGLQFEQVGCLDEFIVVKPFFYHKAMDWMTFGVIPKFLKSKTRFLQNCQQLCNHLVISLDVLVDLVPKVLYAKEFPDLAQMNPMSLKAPDSQKGAAQNEELSPFAKSIKSMIMKPGKEVNDLGDYEMCEIGVPTILKMLLFYFESKPEYLKIEGIFRKSVSIDEEQETINRILERNYDYLLEVKNPHIIANLIKRFFASLKNPIIPFHLFDLLMNDEGIDDKEQHLKRVLEKLPDENKRTLVLVLGFMRESVIPKKEFNKMGSQNLAICFSPCWFRSQNKASIAEIVYASKSVIYSKLLISELDDLFGSPDERKQLYRKSYYDSKKQFEHGIDLGLEATIKGLELANKGIMNSRISSRYSRQLEEPIHIELQSETQMAPEFGRKEHKSKEEKTQHIGMMTRKTKEAKREEAGELRKSKEKIRDPEEPPTLGVEIPSLNENPRFSRAVKDDKEDNFLTILKEEPEKGSARHSRRVDEEKAARQ